MTIPFYNARRVVVNNGAVTTITVNFRAEAAADVHVYAGLTDDVDLPGVVELVQGVDYTVDGVGALGYSVTLANPTGWSDYQRFAVFTQYTVDQPNDVDVGGPFGQRFEDALDRQTFMLQSFYDVVARAIKMPVTDAVGEDNTLDPAPGQLIGWKDDGSGLENKISETQARDEAVAAAELAVSIVDDAISAATDAGTAAGTAAGTSAGTAAANAALATKENISAKGAASGYAPLDSTSKVPAINLPSYVDDVVEGANLAAFPVTGESGKIYVALDTNRTYRWSGSTYVEISPSPGSTDAVTEGATNKYFTESRVLGTVLAGLSVASSAVITAASTVLASLGQLQAQITLYRDRANQTGVQTASTISDLTEVTQDMIASFLTAGTNITFNYNDAGNLLTINASGTIGSAATTVTFTPVGNISATDVQAALAELDTEKVKLSGDTMTGSLVVKLSSIVYDASGTTRAFRMRTGSADRAVFGVDNTTETGVGNAGSNFFLILLDDAGTVAVATPILVDRSTGVMTLGNGKKVVASDGLVTTKNVALSSAADLNTLIAAGEYNVIDPVNAPWTVSGTTWMVKVRQHATNNLYAEQEAWSLNGSPGSRWERKYIGGAWTGWRPIGGIAYPTHFGASASSTPAACIANNTDETANLNRWLAWDRNLGLDGYFLAQGTLTVDATGLQGFSLKGWGARSGFVFNTAGKFQIINLDMDVPWGVNVDTVTLHDFHVYVDYATSNDIITLSAADGDSGGSQCGVDVRNVQIIPTSTSKGTSGADWELSNIRQGHFENCQSAGVYGAYAGVFMKHNCGANSAPGDMTFINCRTSHHAKGSYVAASTGGVANDDHQGFHWISCAYLAVDRGWDIEGGPEGFGEWFTLHNCHTYFREIAFLSTAAGNCKLTDNYFLGHGALSTIQGIGMTGTSIETTSTLVDNRIRLDAASGGTRLGINVTSGTIGYARYNKVSGATTAYTIVAGMTQVGNV